MPRPYPPEFRQRALDLVRSGRPVPEVAKLLGIAESCLHRWKKQDLIDRGLEPGTSRAESAELANAIFEYIEGFHNRRRRHSALGWASPLEFETEHRHQATAPHEPLR